MGAASELRLERPAERRRQENKSNVKPEKIKVGETQGDDADGTPGRNAQSGRFRSAAAASKPDGAAPIPWRFRRRRSRRRFRR